MHSPCDGLGQALPIGRELFGRHTVTLETTRAGRRLATYRIDGLYLQPPGDDRVCDCGDHALLLPTTDGRLVRRDSGVQAS